MPIDFDIKTLMYVLSNYEHVTNTFDKDKSLGYAWYGNHGTLITD